MIGAAKCSHGLDPSSCKNKKEFYTDEKNKTRSWFRRVFVRRTS